MEITLPGFYCPSRRDRDRNGGGVVVFVEDAYLAFESYKADADGTLFWCGMRRGMKRTLNAVSLEDAPESIALACDAVSGARVRFMLSANATNDDVTDDEEFCYGGCTKCGALTCVRTEGGPSPTGLGHCEPRA